MKELAIGMTTGLILMVLSPAWRRRYDKHPAEWESVLGYVAIGVLCSCAVAVLVMLEPYEGVMRWVATAAFAALFLLAITFFLAAFDAYHQFRRAREIAEYHAAHPTRPPDRTDEAHADVGAGTADESSPSLRQAPK